MRIHGALALLSLVAWSGPQADSAASHDAGDIQRTAEIFLTGQAGGHSGEIQVRVKPLDSRIRMPECTEGLTAFFPPGARRTGNVTVGVRCAGPRRWTLYVGAAVRLPREIVVLARPLPRGTQLAKADLRLVRRDTAMLVGGYMTDMQNAVGKVLARSLASGQPVNAGVLSLPKVVHRGQRVTVLARIGALEVRSQGKALSDGRLGELVPVRNSASRRVVEGVVSANGTVVVQM